MNVNKVPNNVRVFSDRNQMGSAAALDIAAGLRQVLAVQESARVIFAAAPSQKEMLTRLAAEQGIDWDRVTAFHMDEYIGLRPQSSARFGNWLRVAIFERVPFATVHYINVDGDPAAGAREYGRLLAEAPLDVACLGIGMNGHIAFNDPAVAAFNDPLRVKMVQLDPICRLQQVKDGCFPSIDDVPTSAVTVTIPTLVEARKIVCVVPGSLKAKALEATLFDPISTACPSTILRRHSDCTIYADDEAASRLD